VLLGASGIEHEEKMSPVVRRDLDAWKKDRGLFQRRSFPVKSVDSQGRVVVGHRDCIEARALRR
jgi:hypothetical protein